MSVLTRFPTARRFARNERGTTAMLFGLALIPAAGLAGAAVDYGRMTTLRAGLQKAADQTALSMVIADHDKRSLDLESTYKAALGPTANAMLQAGKDGLAVSGQWLVAGKEYRVSVAAKTGSTLVGALIGKTALDVGVRATATGRQDRTAVKIEGANLDPEAADYNETQAYCYDSVKKTRLGPLDPDTGKRLDFVKIADNTDDGVKAGPKNVNVLCGDGEEVSFLLKNIREARTSVAKQKSGTPRNFYTDAVKTNGALAYIVTFDGLTRNTLETILCENKAECKPKKEGGILPNNHQTGRLPAVNAKACTTGQFIYFGWEDRIPGYPGDNSDTDFDDIRMFVTCPQVITGPFTVRLSA